MFTSFKVTALASSSEILQNSSNQGFFLAGGGTLTLEVEVDAYVGVGGGSGGRRDLIDNFTPLEENTNSLLGL